ncbi:MAG TPA: hypothetical protein VND98_04645 [Solirubrobacterales bacterium]|nr:hypothetical protein [Solirubrobacterales bacterium]
MKTGHTSGAGYVLVGSGRRKGFELISAAIGAPTDEASFSDNLHLLDYGFSLYRRQRVVRAGQRLADPPIRYAGGALPLVSSRSVEVAVRHGQPLSVKVHAPGEVQGPIRAGAVLGRARVLLDGYLVARVPLRAGRSIPPAGAPKRRRSLITSMPIAPWGIGFVILIGATYLRRRRRPGGEGEERVLVSREERRAAGDRGRRRRLAG